MADNFMTYNDAVDVLTPYAEKINTIKPEPITWAAYQLLTTAQKEAKRYVITDYPSPDGYVDKLSDLEDVDIDDQTLANNQVPVYNSTTEKWENKTILENSLTSTATDMALTAAKGKELEDNKQPKELDTPLTINGTQETTVEGALGGLNDYGNALADNLAANENVYGAKNLIPFPYEGGMSYTFRGVTYTVSDKGIIGTANTATNDGWYVLATNMILASGTYKIEGCPSGGSISTYRLTARVARSGGAVDNYYDVGEGQTFAFNEGDSLNLTINVGNGTDMGGLTFYPMLYDARILDPTYVPPAETNLQLTRKTSGLSNENLLDNGWFTVNQRGFTSGTTAAYLDKYCVDRWKISYRSSGSDGTVTLTSSGLQIVASANGSAVITHTLLNSLAIGTPFTLSVLFSNGTIESYSDNMASSLAKVFDDVILRAQPNVVQVDVRPSKTVTIRAVKLELGSVSTLENDVEPNYTTELLKCQRFFYRILAGAETPLVAIGYAIDATRCRATILLPTKMRTGLPSVSFYGTFQINSDDTSHNVAAVDSVQVSNGNLQPLTLTTSGLTAGHLCALILSNTGYIDFSADL